MNKEIKKLILKIMESVLNINSRNKNTLFFEFFGHINGIRIEYCKNGWSVNIRSDYTQEVYIDTISEKATIKKLNEILDFLKKLEG